MSINIHEPIIPGKSIGGILLGETIEIVLERLNLPFKQTSSWHFIFADVSLWVNETGEIFQISAHHNYKGKILEKISLGNTPEDVERLIGKIMLNDEDNLVIDGIDGLCFEIDVNQNPSTINEIFIFNS